MMSQILVCNQTLMLVSSRQKWNHTPIFHRRNNPPEEVCGFEDHHNGLLKLYNEPCLLVGTVSTFLSCLRRDVTLECFRDAWHTCSLEYYDIELWTRSRTSRFRRLALWQWLHRELHFLFKENRLANKPFELASFKSNKQSDISLLWT